jgi:hypothetical protein
MSCSNNNNNCGCGCDNTSINPCGCKTSSDEVVYVGPPLGCTGISNCDTVTEAFQAIDAFICGPGMVETIIYNITNNSTLYAEFVTIVNNSVDCETVWDCIDSTSTTTTTTTFACEGFSLDNLSTDTEAIIITNCITGLQEAVVLLPGITDICVETNSPLTVPGTVIATPTGPCNTTTTTSSSTTSTTTTLFIPCECLTIHNTDSVGQYFSYTDCNNVISDFIPISAEEIVNVCGCCVSATNPLVTISIGENCISGVCPTTTTTSSTSTTSTTTTVYPYPCSCVHVTISQTDIDDATGNTPAPGKADNTVYLTTTKFAGCDGSEIAGEYTTAGLDGFCIKTSELSNIALFYYKNNNPVYFPAIASTYNILYASCSVSGECIPV